MELKTPFVRLTPKSPKGDLTANVVFVFKHPSRIGDWLFVDEM